MASEEPVTGEKPTGDGERLAAELGGSLGSSLAETGKELFTAFGDALAGKSDAKRLVKDASRITSRAIRDTAKLFVLGLELAKVMADLPVEDTAPTETPCTTEPPGATLEASPLP